MNKFNGISKDNYENLRDHIKNNPERKDHIRDQLKQELKDPAEVHN